MALRLAGGQTRRYGFYAFAVLCVFAAVKSGLDTGSLAGPILFGVFAVLFLLLAYFVNRGVDARSEKDEEPLTPAKVALLMLILVVIVGQFIWRMFIR